MIPRPSLKAVSFAGVALTDSIDILHRTSMLTFLYSVIVSILRRIDRLLATHCTIC